MNHPNRIKPKNSFKQESTNQDCIEHYTSGVKLAFSYRGLCPAFLSVIQLRILYNKYSGANPLKRFHRPKGAKPNACPTMITEHDIQRRNKRVVDFFSRSGFSIKLIGDSNCPAIIYNDLFCLSCYVKNFDLIFTDKPKAGSEIFRVKLESESRLEKNELMEILDNAEHRRVFKVKVSNSDLFLSGYNFLDKARPETRYPVFAKYGAKLYFDQEYANQICLDYNEYDLVVV